MVIKHVFLKYPIYIYVELIQMGIEYRWSVFGGICSDRMELIDEHNTNRIFGFRIIKLERET